jgi:hypothetical protein
MMGRCEKSKFGSPESSRRRNLSIFFFVPGICLARLWLPLRARPAAPDRAVACRAPWIPCRDCGSRPFGLPSLARNFCPSPGALGPAFPRLRSASERRGRYANAPAGAPLTGLGAGDWPALRSGSYAHFAFDWKRGVPPHAVKTEASKKRGPCSRLAALGSGPHHSRVFWS